MDQLIEIIKSESRTITEEFRLASKQASGTAQEVADFREHAVQAFLSRFYPSSHIISKGKVTDLNGYQSNSIDCLVLNPAHPYLVDSKGKFRLNIADGVDAAIEVKPDLANGSELIRGLKQGASLKAALRSKSPILRQSVKPSWLIEHSKRIPFYIFSIKSFEPYDLCVRIVQHYTENKVPEELQIDGIFIMDVGILKNITRPELNMYGASYPVGKNSGWYMEQWDDAALIGLLLSLEYSFASHSSISESIMKRVLAKLGRSVTRINNCV